MICGVNGYCLGGGLELAMAADLRIAATDAVFGQPEIGLGCFPGGGGTERLALLVGRTRAKELLWTGRPFSAAEALSWGLVSSVVPATDLAGAVLDLAGQLADDRERWRPSRRSSTRRPGPGPPSWVRCRPSPPGWRRCTPATTSAPRWSSWKQAAVMNRDDVPWRGYWVAAPDRVQGRGGELR